MAIIRIQTRLMLLMGAIVFIFAIGAYVLVRSQNAKVADILGSRGEEKRSLVKELMALYSEPPRNMAYDYSYWDEMVAFVDRPDTAWGRENIEISLETFKSTVAWIYDNHARKIYSAMNEPQPSILSDTVFNSIIIRAFSQNWFSHFFYRGEFGVVEIFTAPVQPGADNERQTLPVGYLVIGKIIDDKYIKNVADVAEVDVSVLTSDAIPSNPEPGAITFFEPLPGADGEPVAYLHCHTHDPLFAMYTWVSRAGVMALAILAGTLISLSLLSLIFWVNRPLNKISAALESGDVQKVISMTGVNSEFGQIARLMKDFFAQKMELVQRINAQNRTQKALVESETRYRVVSEQTGQMVYDWHLVSGNITWAGGIVSITGYTGDEYQKVDIKEWERMIHPDDRSHATAELDAAAQSGSKYVVEYRLRRKDGSYIYVEDNGVFITNDMGEPVRMLGTMRDITERKNAEEEQKKLASIVKYSAELVNLSRPDGTMVFLNEAGSRMLGIAPEEVARTNIMDVIPNHLKARVEKTLLTVLKAGGVWEGELQYRNLKTGKLTDVHVMTFAIMDPTGKSVQYFANVSLDITGRKLAEARQAGLQEQLERAQRMESLAVLAGGVAHDLNNMLGPVVGYAELLLRSLPQDSDNAVKARRILDSAQDAAGIIQDLQALAQRGKYEKTILDLNQVVHSFFESASVQRLKERYGGIEIAARLTERPCVIKGSYPHLEKILMNLMINACEAMPNGGTVTVETDKRQLKTLIGGYGGIAEAQYILLRVKDSGAGIDRGDLQRIFEPYFSKKQRKNKGSGLGLSVVHGVVKDHGGYYDVFSEVGKGTEFIIYFPSCGFPDNDPISAVESLTATKNQY